MQRGRLRIEQGRKRVRTYLAGQLVADTRRPLLVWEKPYYPVYYFPEADVYTDLLVPTETTRRSPSRGTARFFDIKAARSAGEAAYRYEETDIDDLRDHYAFVWDSMDAWFEEDEEVYVHARDPYTRVDVLSSSRHIEVVINGVKVADSTHPTLLFETGLPTRYYLPKVDVRMDLLTPTDLHTRCPYKGTADYWTVHAGGEDFENYAWGYPFPAAEAAKVAGLVAFYDEKVDVYVDGELQDRPRSVFG